MKKLSEKKTEIINNIKKLNNVKLFDIIEITVYLKRVYKFYAKY